MPTILSANAHFIKLTDRCEFFHLTLLVSYLYDCHPFLTASFLCKAEWASSFFATAAIPQRSPIVGLLLHSTLQRAYHPEIKNLFVWLEVHQDCCQLLVEKLNKLIGMLVSGHQNAFTMNRQIIDAAVIANEVLTGDKGGEVFSASLIWKRILISWTSPTLLQF